MKRFWSKVKKTNGCWEWTAALAGEGYGTFQRGVRDPIYAHRFAYIMTHGQIPNGKFVLHRCDNKICVRPSHLFLGTQKDNIVDAVSKGRMAVGNKNGSRLHPERLVRGERHPLVKLSERDVLHIRYLYANGGITMKILGQQYGVTEVCIRSVITRRTWNHV